MQARVGPAKKGSITIAIIIIIIIIIIVIIITIIIITITIIISIISTILISFRGVVIILIIIMGKLPAFRPTVASTIVCIRHRTGAIEGRGKEGTTSVC